LANGSTAIENREAIGFDAAGVSNSVVTVRYVDQ
jgi:hypothetical protein